MNDFFEKERASRLISVVTPAYNASDTITRAIESVLVQDPTIPYFVVDDCSSGDHQYHLGSYPSLTLLRNEVNMGGASTRNVGLSMVETPYVLFLDADDYILPESIEELMNMVQSDSSDIIYFPWFKMNKRGIIYGPLQNGCRDPITMFSSWLDGKYVPPCAVVWRVDFLREIGSWGEGLRYNDDGELSLRALLHNPRIAIAKRGGGVYIKGVNPNAVSNSDIEIMIISSIHIFGKIRELINDQIDDKNISSVMISKMGKVMYLFARSAFEKRLDNLAEIALASSRDLGFRGYYGNLTYRVLAKVIGPKYAEWIASTFKKLSQVDR
jgi:glycosyltransferase involved in cell wall biosynthesis